MGENCVSEKNVGDCCPTYWCPQVYTHPSTEKPDTEPRGCYLDGKYYDEGDRIPMDPMKPCEACYCIRNTSVCTEQKCELEIDGCFPQYKLGSCCPSRYNCTEQAATTIPPGLMDDEDYEGCRVNGVLYKDGDLVPSENKCETCYCMKHVAVCAVQECTAPAENCVPATTTEIPVFSTTFASLEDLGVNISTIEDRISTIADTTAVEFVGEMKNKVYADRRYFYYSSSRKEKSSTPVISDLVTRRREPKITESPEDPFASVGLPKTTGKPIFSRPVPGEVSCSVRQWVRFNTLRIWKELQGQKLVNQCCPVYVCVAKETQSEITSGFEVQETTKLDLHNISKEHEPEEISFDGEDVTESLSKLAFQKPFQRWQSQTASEETDKTKFVDSVSEASSITAMPVTSTLKTTSLTTKEIEITTSVKDKEPEEVMIEGTTTEVQKSRY
ncbi:hypothetical protein CEXT_777121 [Caerostris extrusa]|uniref:VWFC domain-containing protein n=1 Tax=Caerostris extrusa TaxID=172846 RepID=A0AAV4V606_CAEEX|nr:hypothetical protein CEXT_777121 [Caerostris extrusa]